MLLKFQSWVQNHLIGKQKKLTVDKAPSKWNFSVLVSNLANAKSCLVNRQP
jgi:hypothetical protein